MEKRQLGQTDMHISRLGIGLAEIGFNRVEQDAADRLLNTALDRGINFLDTAIVYDISEDLVGRAVSHRRDEFYLATKCGNVAPTEAERWTAATVTANTDTSLKRLQVEHLDLVQLHSCSLEILQRGEVIEALKQAQQAGKTRYIGYSGDNDAALWAVESGHFDTLQTSFNLVDQKARYQLFDAIETHGLGLICKRPIGNGAWGAAASPSDYAQAYFERAEAMRALGDLPDAPANRILLALGFIFGHAVVDTAIVGTHNLNHLQSNIDMVENELPIAETTIAELHRRFDELGTDWPQRG